MGCSIFLALSFCFAVFFLTSIAVFLTRGRKRAHSERFTGKGTLDGKMNPDSLGYVIAFCIAFTIFVITTIIVCVRRRQKARNNVGSVFSAPVVVTSATHTAPGGYPVSQIPPGGVPANVYAPYPGQHNMTATNMQMPMAQPPVGFQQQTTPYPPYPPMGMQPAAANMNPPSYEAAVSGVGIGAGNTAPYEKQAPYNPNFSQ